MPLLPEHHDGLVDAVRDGELWQLWFTFIPAPGDMAAEIQRRLELQATGKFLAFTVLDSTGKAAGMTSFLNVDANNRRVEIGTTWYRKSVQRTALNTECKLLLLTHAFEQKNCIAVEFRTHIANERSRAAILRLGAKLDGILRSHMIMPNGTLRDTAVHSITAAEWPDVKAHLARQLDTPCG